MKWFIVFMIMANNGQVHSFTYENHGYDSLAACQTAVDEVYLKEGKDGPARMICTGNHVFGDWLQAQMKKDQQR